MITTQNALETIKNNGYFEVKRRMKDENAYAERDIGRIVP